MGSVRRSSIAIDAARRRARRVLAQLVVPALALTSYAALALPAAEADTLTPAHVAVDFGADQGPLLHTERYNNFHVSTTFSAQRPADVSYLNQQGMHGTIYRAWLNSPNQTEPTCTNPDPNSSDPCVLSPSMDAYLTDLEKVSDAQIGNLRLDAWIGQDTATAKAGMERIVLAVKQGQQSRPHRSTRGTRRSTRRSTASTAR
jgi:hypothetical protein